MGFKAARSPHPRQPGQRVAGQLAGPLAPQPASDAELVELGGSGAAPGLPWGHLGHQLLKAPLQGQGLSHLASRQAQLFRPEEQQAGAKVVFNASPMGRAVPVENPFACVVGGVALQAKLPQQLQQALVRGAHPLAAQIQRQAHGAGAAPHPAAAALPCLQQPHLQAPPMQVAGADQPGEAGAHHHHIDRASSH